MFKYTPQQLSQLFDQDNIKDGKSIEMIKSWGKLEGIAETLHTNLKKGTQDNADSQEKRRAFFGDNKPITKPKKTLWQLILDNFEDLMLRVLCAAAVISLVLGIASEGIKKGWMEGTSILVAVVIIISVTAGNNYIKQRQFEKLNKDATKKSLLVRRSNQDIRIDSSQLLVGDLQLLQTGQIASVDGILVESNLLVTDQSAMTGQPKEIKKHVAVTFQSDQNVNPFIVSGSKVLEGTGKMIVLAVGEHSQYGKLKKALAGEDDETPLQQKLSILAQQIGLVGTVCAGATFVCLLGHIAYGIYQRYVADGSKQLLAHIFTAHILSQMVQSFIVAISIIVVSVPEGLPLAVTIALAYSVGKMKDENNLVRYLQACQTMGGVDNICSDKTGTLTKNRMNVTRAFIWNQDVSDKDIKKVINESFAQLLSQSICQNSNATPIFTRKDDGSILSEQNGNKTECALLEMAFNLGYSYLQQRNQNNQLAVFPFSSKNKWMTSLCIHKGSKYVFTKGAADFLLPHCKKYYDKQGNIQDVTPQYIKELKNTIEKYADATLRTLLLTCKEYGNDASYKTDVEANQNLIIMCLVGIKDPIRDEIPHAVQTCHTAGVTVRMITGDNQNTAVAIAKQAGILPKDWQSKGDDDKTVMLGKDFRAFVGGIKNQGTHEQSVGSIENFKKVAASLKVLARSSPTDKYIMATGLKQLDHVVAMTGDGTNDAPALKKADIGFAMGMTGTQVAKQAAGIILLDDNFKSIVTAMKWGRNIFDSIRKFLQFQLTVNVVALVLAFTGAAVLKQSPLNPIQMLWINLIMDTLASLALATEPPSDQLLLRKPYSRFESLITADMWKNIISQSILQIIILGTILFKGPQLFGVPSSFGHKQWSQNNGKHLCLFFHTFVLLQIFNQINARKLKSSEINVFKNYFNNMMFHLIMVLTIAIQILCIQFGGSSLKAVPLTPREHLICIGLGMSSIFMGVIFKLIVPVSLFNFLVRHGKKEKQE